MYPALYPCPVGRGSDPKYDRGRAILGEARGTMSGPSVGWKNVVLYGERGGEL